MNKILEVKNLEVGFINNNTRSEVLKKIDFDLFENESLGIVGESGSGKSTIALSILKLLAQNSYAKGRVNFENVNLLALKEKELLSYRGKKIGMIFQDPLSSLNPTMKIFYQLKEAFVKEDKINLEKARLKALSLLDLVGIKNPMVRLMQYPHELSGGMRQRILIAIAIAASPKIIIADEPTSSLDATLQIQIANLLLEVKKKTKAGIIFISHDLALVSAICDRILVMYKGKIVEQGGVKELLTAPKHPYTQMLLNTIKALEEEKPLFLELKNHLEEKNGCPYLHRCICAKDICREKSPSLKSTKNHSVACHLTEEK
ncbi:MAG: ABC transporter ATP-binding protein [Chlamydiae bacterium]|nr:ABC transporter ATP-binding protein [Chlamydiota bacterium]